MFAGSARVTACLRYIGLAGCFGVDHVLNNNVAKVVSADLTTDSGQTLFWKWVTSDQCFGVFVAPPCGTCSLARNIPIRVPGSRNRKGPPPLRSTLHPDGLPSLTWTQRARVGAANKLYSFLTEVALYCIKNNKIICIENPSSLYWLTSFVQPLLRFLFTRTIEEQQWGFNQFNDFLGGKMWFRTKPKKDTTRHELLSGLHIRLTCGLHQL